MSRIRSALAAVAAGLLTVTAPAAARQTSDAATPPATRPAVDTTADVPSLLPPPVLRSQLLRVSPLWSAERTAGTRSPAASPPDQAIEHTDAYYTRLDIHRWGSYAMLPLFAGEYLLGNELLNGSNPAGWVRGAHGVGAGALGVLFGVNTVTGVWNLVESRQDPGALRRILHSTLMLAADAGFLYTASLAGENEFEGGFRESEGDNRRHRDWALGSMALSTAGTLLMWLWKD